MTCKSDVLHVQYSKLYGFCTSLNDTDDLPLHMITVLRIFQLGFCTTTRGQKNAGMSLKFGARAASMQVGNL